MENGRGSVFQTQALVALLGLDEAKPINARLRKGGFDRIWVNTIGFHSIEISATAYISDKRDELFLRLFVKCENHCFSADTVGKPSKIILRNEVVIGFASHVK